MTGGSSRRPRCHTRICKIPNHIPNALNDWNPAKWCSRAEAIAHSLSFTCRQPGLFSSSPSPPRLPSPSSTLPRPAPSTNHTSTPSPTPDRPAPPPKPPSIQTRLCNLVLALDYSTLFSRPDAHRTVPETAGTQLQIRARRKGFGDRVAARSAIVRRSPPTVAGVRRHAGMRKRAARGWAGLGGAGKGRAGGFA